MNFSVGPLGIILEIVYGLGKDNGLFSLMNIVSLFGFSMTLTISL